MDNTFTDWVDVCKSISRSFEREESDQINNLNKLQFEKFYFNKNANVCPSSAGLQIMIESQGWEYRVVIAVL